MSNNKLIVNVVVGLVLMGVGAMALIAQVSSTVFGFDLWTYLWPYFIIGIGTVFFVGMVAGGRSTGALAIPGSIISTIGLILLVQNMFDVYETWAYAWALIIVSVGVGIMINGIWSGNLGSRENGARLARLGFVLFLVFGVFFEFVIGISGFRYGGMVWPLFIIAAGVYLVLRQTVLRNALAGPNLTALWNQYIRDTDRPKDA